MTFEGLFVFSHELQLLVNHVGAHINVAAAHGEDKVAFLSVFADVIRDLLKGVETYGVRNLRAEVARVDVVGICLSDGQDLGDYRDVGNLQSLGKVVEEHRGAREGVGLENRPDLAEAHVHSRVEGGCELRGVMREVVGDGDSVGSAEDFKAAVNSAELVQVLGDLVRCSAEVVSCCRRRERVVDVVLSGDNQLYARELFALVKQVVLLVNPLVGAEVDRAVVAVFAEAEGDLVELNVLYGVEGVFVVAVDNEETRGQLCEFLKGFLYVVEVLEVVEVVGVDIEDN